MPWITKSSFPPGQNRVHFQPASLIRVKMTNMAMLSPSSSQILSLPWLPAGRSRGHTLPEKFAFLETKRFVVDFWDANIENSNWSKQKTPQYFFIWLGPLRIHFGAMKTGVNLRRIWQNSDGLSQFIFSSQFWPNVASWLFWQCQLMKEKQPPCWNSLRHAQPPVLQHFGQFGRLPKLALFHSYTVNYYYFSSSNWHRPLCVAKGWLGGYGVGLGGLTVSDWHMLCFWWRVVKIEG